MSDQPLYPPDPLGMDAETMRRLGYQVVDWVVERHGNKHLEPAIRTGQPDDLFAVLGGELPEQPSDPEAALALLVQEALSHQQHTDHPRYFARVPGPASLPQFWGLAGYRLQYHCGFPGAEVPVRPRLNWW
ncbi:MAG: hypothetical protein R3E95_23090 [Thiolinea sp.]